MVILALIAGGLYVASLERSLSGVLVKEAEEDEEEVLIGVISDTHIPTRAEVVPSEVLQVFQNASFIIHAGDFVQISVVEELERIAPVVGVQGNMDHSSVISKYPKLNTLEILGWRIGVVHNGFPLLRKRRLKEMARKNNFDVLVFGHTHVGSVEVDENTLFINPGSPTQPFLSKASVGILKITKKRVEAKIIILQ